MGMSSNLFQSMSPVNSPGGMSSGAPTGGMPMMGSSGGSSGLASLFSGLFGDSGSPYGDAMKEFMKYYQQAQGAQNPFFNAGTSAIGPYQDWLKKMSDPSGFINNMMGQYKESPWSHHLQDQSMRAGTNAASMGGLPGGEGGAGIGSTPFAQQMQQNSSNIASGDMNTWLQHALGINTQYGDGQKGMIDSGQHAGDMMSQLAMMMGGRMGEGAFGQKFGENQDFMNTISGIGKLLFGSNLF
jgi:hypothetical protein